MDKVSITSSEIRGVVRKEIPFVTGAWVEIFDDITINDIKLAQSLKDNQDIDKNIDFIAKQISAWNFIDIDGNDIPINSLGVSQLPFKVIKWIFDSVGEVLNNEDLLDKKK